MFKNETSIYCLYRLMSESLNHSLNWFIRTLIDSGTPLLCVTVVHSAVASFGTIFVDGAKIDKASDNTVSKMCYIINPMIWEHMLVEQYCMQAITHIWLFFYYCCFKHGPAPFNLYLYFFLFSFFHLFFQREVASN